MEMKRIVVLLSLIMVTLNITSCSSPVADTSNPLLTEWDTPFGVPPFDRIESKHYEPAFEEAMKRHNSEIEAILANTEEPTFENTILELDRSGELLATISELFGMMCAAMNDEDMTKIQEKVMPLLSAHYDAISMNEALFQRIKVVYDKRNSSGLNAEQIRLVEKMFDSAKRQGALLDADKKQRLMEINEELSLLTVRFDNNLLAETNDFKLELSTSEVNDLPKAVREA